MSSIPLIGFTAIVSREDCELVRLETPAGERTFVREGDDQWKETAADSHPFGAARLLEEVERAAVPPAFAVTCLLPREEVEYRLAGSAVRLERRQRAAEIRAVEEAVAGLDDLIERLDIPSAKRLEKVRQGVHFARTVLLALGQRAPRRIRVLDLACGRSYLSFVLERILRQAGHDVAVHGVDSNGELVARCRATGERVGATGFSFETASLADYRVPEGSYDVVAALHACDNLTDDAIRVAIQGRVGWGFFVPCCQHEFRHLLGDHSLDWLGDYGLLEQRMADILTDGFRCLVLAAAGYDVKVIRFADEDLTPKNLLIQAVLTDRPSAKAKREAETFMQGFRIRPKLAGMLGWR